MVRLQLIKDADGAVLTFDAEYEVILSNEGFAALVERLNRVGRVCEAMWLFDPEDDDEEREVEPLPDDLDAFEV